MSLRYYQNQESSRQYIQSPAYFDHKKISFSLVNIMPQKLRNIFSFVLMILLMLNVMGYYGLFVGWQYKNDRDMTEKLDAGNYDNAETITIRIPLTVPYAMDSREFERVNGEFEYNGEFYRLIKQKLSQDTLFIVCVKDQENKRIHQALSGFVKSFSDKPADHSSNTKTAVNFIKDYIAQSFALGNQSTGWVSDVNKECSSHILVPAFCASIVHPPERG